MKSKQLIERFSKPEAQASGGKGVKGMLSYYRDADQVIRSLQAALECAI